MNKPNYYNFIYDEKELYWFFENVIPGISSLESFYVSVAFRKKYISEEQIEEYELGRTAMVDRKIIRYKDWSKFLSTIKKFNCEYGSYLSKNKLPLPQECGIIYWNINPSSVLIANSKFVDQYNEYMTEMCNNLVKNKDTENISLRMSKLDVMYKACYQKNASRKVYIDIDFDIEKDNPEHKEILNYFLDSIKENSIKFFVIETYSGYHVLIKKETIKYNYNETLIECQNRLFELCNRLNPSVSIKYGDKFKSEFHLEIEKNKNDMIPLPGTYQGGFKVNVIKELSNY